MSIIYVQVQAHRRRVDDNMNSTFSPSNAFNVVCVYIIAFRSSNRLFYSQNEAADLHRIVSNGLGTRKRGWERRGAKAMKQESTVFHILVSI